MANAPSLRADRTSNTQQSLRSIRNSHERNCNKYTLVALGIILLIGSLIASGCLYADVGHWSLAIGAGGLIVGFALIVGGLCCNRKPSSQPHPKEKPRTSPQPHPKEKPHLEKEEKKPAPQNQGEEKRIPYNSAKPLQVPTRASDIKLLETLPKYSWEVLLNWDLIPPEPNPLNNYSLQTFITYLATQFPIVTFSPLQLALLEEKGYCFPDKLEEYIFNLGPSIVKDVFNNPNLDLPIYLNLSGHWTLVYIDRENRTIEYYDSKIMNSKDHAKILQKLNTIAKRLSQQEPGKPYEVKDKIHKVLQNDGYQCGLWVLFFLEGRLIDPKFDFNTLDIKEAQELIKKYRQKVRLNLLEMGEAHDAALEKESANYRLYYKDEKLAAKMLDQDRRKFSFVDRWKQRLYGPLLDPSQQVSEV
jgi:hypothetical protein